MGWLHLGNRITRQRGFRPPRSGPSATLLVAAVAILAGCSGDPADRADAKAAQASPPIPVSVRPVITKSVPVQVRANGSAQPHSTVSVRSQVDGEIRQVHFTEGQEVKKGELLFTLDRRPFEAALSQAEASMARDKAQLETARTQVRRYEALINEGAISREQYDQVRTAADALDGTVRADQAVVENARIQLGYTEIRAPIAGRTGNLLVHPGNTVKARDETAPLVVINEIRPIFVAFSVPEQYLAEVQKYRAAGSIRVDALIPGQEESPVRGDLTFVNNTVDPSTGTIQLKATFANAENRLWPGQFLNVLMTLTTEPNRVVVPSQAIQTGQRGPYVFVVKPDLTVELRPIAPGLSLDGETVVAKGLTPGERVVTEGQIRLVPGARVEIRSPAPAGAPQEKAG